MAETVLGWTYEQQTEQGLRVFSGPETRVRSDDELTAHSGVRDDDPDDAGRTTEARGDEHYEVLAGRGMLTRGEDERVPAGTGPPTSDTRGDEQALGGPRPRPNPPYPPEPDPEGPESWVRGDEEVTDVTAGPPLTHSRSDDDLVAVGLASGPDPAPEESKSRGDE